MLLLLLTALLVVSSATGGYFFYQYKIKPGREISEPVNALSIKNKDPFSQSSRFVGQVRPEFSLPDVNGTVRHVSEWDGQVLALNFWATWCPPCLKEIPEFVQLQHEYAD
ncbi:MAG: redoxin domain-containing protein, partial [Gammaproteobacteria bacterium]|nr:redoxin domain-containing protein [Gammaproteobacteria bacterium]NIO62387.1 redoxin domain-containing protein [Gammaproteobacteria bacterium]